jgi:hypothetical protein
LPEPLRLLIESNLEFFIDEMMEEKLKDKVYMNSFVKQTIDEIAE